MQSTKFRLFYYVALIAWTLAALGMLSQLRNDLRLFEYAIIFISGVACILGWCLPSFQVRRPENLTIKRAVFLFPFISSALLLIFLVLGVVFGAA